MVTKKSISKRAQTIERTFVAKICLTLIGVALVQLALCGAYLAAFHAPHAQNVPVQIVGNTETVKTIANAVQQKSNGAYAVSITPTRAAAIENIQAQQSYAAYIPGSAASNKAAEVIVASASSQSLAGSIPSTFAAVSTQMHTPQSITDIAPLPSGDSKGLSIFYTAFSWVFGGYLAAAAIGVVRGDRAFTKRNALLRVGALAVFSAITSLLVAAIAVHSVHAFTHGYWTLAGIGTLATLATALSASVIIAFVGTLGTALVILLFVVLGNPASGGTIPLQLIGNGPWSWFSHALPTGVGVDAIRASIYFGGSHLATSMVTYLCYISVSAALLLSIGHFRGSMDFYAKEIAVEA